MTGKRKVMLAWFPYGGTLATETANWLIDACEALQAHPNVSEVLRWYGNDTPTDMVRNRCLAIARQVAADYVLMVDSDMVPDLYVGAKDDQAVPFLPSALDFALAHNGPCVIGAPYCGPPPLEDVYVHRWANRESDHPAPDARLRNYERQEAAALSGIGQVASLPTGCILIDMRAVDRMKPPYFLYEFDPDHTRKISTEDVVFTRDLTFLGVPQYCHWSAWSGHVKRKIVGSPRLLPPEVIPERFRAELGLPQAVVANATTESHRGNGRLAAIVAET